MYIAVELVIWPNLHALFPPNSKDLKVVLKKEYNAEKSVKNNALLSGSAWYTLQAFRALNQAVGRIIRHSRDFGAVVLIGKESPQQFA